jgi:hypothetical protein
MFNDLMPKCNGANNGSFMWPIIHFLETAKRHLNEQEMTQETAKLD